MADIDELLAQARTKVAGYGEKYGASETADDYLKATFAMLYEDAPGGSIPDREAWVRRQPEYLQALERKKSARSEWKAAEVFMKILFTEAEVWRTKQANNRLMDGAHR